MKKCILLLWSRKPHLIGVATMDAQERGFWHLMHPNLGIIVLQTEEQYRDALQSRQDALGQAMPPVQEVMPDGTPCSPDFCVDETGKIMFPTPWRPYAEPLR